MNRDIFTTHLNNMICYYLLDLWRQMVEWMENLSKIFLNIEFNKAIELTYIIFHTWSHFFLVIFICYLIPYFQVYEMFVSGYLFQVITPLFACHWGLQTKKTRPQWREAQNNANRKQLDDFKREVYVRYQRDPLNIAAKDFQKFFETKKKKHSRWFSIS